MSDRIPGYPDPSFNSEESEAYAPSEDAAELPEALAASSRRFSGPRAQVVPLLKHPLLVLDGDRTFANQARVVVVRVPLRVLLGAPQGLWLPATVLASCADFLLREGARSSVSLSLGSPSSLLQARRLTPCRWKPPCAGQSP